jgi:ABC-2 type transport system ATP-binding protein
MIKTINLTKKFDNIVALDQVSIHVKKGSIYGLVGPNGSGKTTLIKTLAGIYKQNAGSAKINGEDIYENNQVKSKLVYIPDDLYFFPTYSVLNMARFYSETYDSFDWYRFEKIIKTINIDKKRRVFTLSKGMKKQVEFCLAIAIKPEILILDEPVDGLDPIMRRQIWSLLLQDVAEREMTVLISSHNLRELEDVCDYVGILHRGKLVDERNLDDLKTNIYKVQVAFKKEANLEGIEILKEEQVGKVKMLIVRGNRDEIENELNKYSPLLLDFISLTLEEIFIYEVGGRGYEVEKIIL